MRITLDSNVLVYAMERSTGRPEIARAIVEALPGVDAILTMQVLGEFLNVVRRKNRLELPGAIAAVELWESLYPVVATRTSDLTTAAHLAQRYQLQYWDSLIVTVAATANVEIMLTEDMQDGASIAGIRLVNPFEPGNRALLDELLTPAPGTA